MLNLLHFTTVPMLLTPPSSVEYLALIPGSIVALSALLIVLIDTSHRIGTSRSYLAYMSSIGLACAILSTYFLWDKTLDVPVFHGMLYLDKFSLFAGALCCASGIFALLMSPAFLRNNSMDRGEFYMLTLFSVCGMVFMVASADLLMLFISLELMSIPIYCLAAFLRKDKASAEAGLKYFILGAFSTCFLLYGIALLYGLTGTTNLEYIAQAIANLPDGSVGSAGPILAIACLLVLSGFIFKIAAVPFHYWTPDVYTGSPTPIVGFMATAVKLAAFAGMIRVFICAFYAEPLRGVAAGAYGWHDFAWCFAILSMVLGNLCAITQKSIKRMLAYSSIAHAGYLLVGFVAANSAPEYFLYNDAILFYLATYTFGTLGAFGVLAYLTKNGTNVETYEDIAGVGLKFPMLGIVMAICMLSSAGIPPTAGFLGKFYVFRAAVDAGFVGTTICALMTSIAGVYYYLKVLVFMYMKPVQNNVSTLPFRGASFALVASAALTLYLGILPGKTLDLARQSVTEIAGVPEVLRPIQSAGKAARAKLNAETADGLAAP